LIRRRGVARSGGLEQVSDRLRFRHVELRGGPYVRPDPHRSASVDDVTGSCAGQCELPYCPANLPAAYRPTIETPPLPVSISMRPLPLPSVPTSVLRPRRVTVTGRSTSMPPLPV